MGSLADCLVDGKSADELTRERDGLLTNQHPEEEGVARLLTLESRWDVAVAELAKKRVRKRVPPSFAGLVERIEGKIISCVRVVLGTANQSSISGHRMEQALAYDALGIDLLIAWFKEKYGISVEIVLAHEEKEVKKVPQEELTILVGSGRTNPATHRCLERLAEVIKLPGVSFLHPEGNLLCDGQDVSYTPELGMLAVVPCPAGGDGLVVISAGVGREGTAAANHALAEILGAGKAAVAVVGWDSIDQAAFGSAVVQATIASRDDRISQVDVHQRIPESLQAKAPPARPEETSST